MARRIIYIKNPSSGSNFRTINGGGGGGGAPRPKAPKMPRPSPLPPTPTGPFEGTGGAHYAQTPSDWFIGNTTDAIDFGNYDPNAPGTGATELDFTPTFLDPQTLLGILYDIATGTAEGGNIQFPYGTPGTLKGEFGDLSYEAFDANRQLYRHRPNVFGATPSNPFPTIGVPGLNPNRNKNRPWWAK